MAKILSIESSTEVCSVALATNGNTVDLEENTQGMNHSEFLTVFVDRILTRNKLRVQDLDAFAVSSGPGSYTGLRIGISAAKGLCYGSDKPLIAVGTLDAAALYVASHPSEFGIEPDEKTLLCPMLDARRMEVFCALYNSKGEKTEEVSARIIEPDSFGEIMENHRLVFFGNGASKAEKILNHPNAFFAGPKQVSARFLAGLAEYKFSTKQFEDVAYFEPFYLKDFVATVPKNKIF
jgi:tRNA threonylcarbamoyladenosine biosynthesis protein TsaB